MTLKPWKFPTAGDAHEEQLMFSSLQLQRPAEPLVVPHVRLLTQTDPSQLALPYAMHRQVNVPSCWDYHYL